MCRHLALIARGVGHEATKNMIMPQLVELSNDEVSDVRLAAIETVVNLLSVLDDDICTQTIVPLVIKSCDQVSNSALIFQICRKTIFYVLKPGRCIDVLSF